MNKRQRLQSALVSSVGRKADLATREQVFRCVAADGADSFATVPAMVNRLSKRGNAVNAVTVNNHLRALKAAGIVEVIGKQNAPGRGRPAAVWGLTARGEEVSALR